MRLLTLKASRSVKAAYCFCGGQEICVEIFIPPIKILDKNVPRARVNDSLAKKSKTLLKNEEL